MREKYELPSVHAIMMLNTRTQLEHVWKGVNVLSLIFMYPNNSPEQRKNAAW